MNQTLPTSLDQVTNEELLEVLRSLALEKCSANLELFAETFFSSHLTITMPPYHREIYKALSGLFRTPGAPPTSSEVGFRPTPKSLQFSKVSKTKSDKEYEESSLLEYAQNQGASGVSGSHTVTEDALRFKQEFRNSVVVEPREFGKSTKAMIYVMWAIIHRLKKFVLYISKSHDHAVKLVGPIKREFEANELLRDVYGDLRADKWTEGEMEFANGSKLLAVGRGQTVRGLKYLNHRPDLVILDDIEDDESVENKELRLKLHEWLDKQVIPGVDSKKGTVSAFGTILHPVSLLAELSTKENRSEKYANFLPLFYGALDKEDRSIWEDKFSTEQLLLERKRDFYTFAQERMNQPIPIGSGMFKREYFKYFTISDGMIQSEGRVIPLSSCNVYLTCDIAMTVKEYSDYTVLLVSAISPDNEIFVLDYTRERWEDPDRIMAEIFRLNAKYPTIKMNGVETVAAQKWLLVNMNKEMRKRNIFLPLKALVADKDKLRRISQLQPRFSNHSVFIKNHMSELEEELLLFPKSAHDDVSDALAYVLQIALTPDKDEAPLNRRARREDYKFSMSGEEVLGRIRDKSKVKGVFKEYQTEETFDPYKDNEFDNAVIQRWDEVA